MYDTGNQAPAETPTLVAPMPSGRATRRKRRSTKGGGRASKVLFELMIRKAIRCTFHPSGSTKQRIVQFIRKKYDLPRNSGAYLSKSFYKMLCEGYIYRNRFNPLKFKLTMKGYRLKRLDLLVKKRKKARRRRTIRRRRRQTRRRQKRRIRKSRRRRRRRQRRRRRVHRRRRRTARRSRRRVVRRRTRRVRRRAARRKTKEIC